jgi:hypothetical protein
LLWKGTTVTGGKVTAQGYNPVSFTTGPLESDTTVVVVLSAHEKASPPIVDRVTPNAGLQGGGTPVIVTGEGFTGATAVRFGAVRAISMTVESATEITAITPTGTGTVEVSVTTAAGTSLASPGDVFTYVPLSLAPVLKKVSPVKGLAAGGTTVTITGTGFTGATAVRFGSASAASYTVKSATSITAVSPAATPGTVDITVTTPNGTSAATAADHFTYQ